MSDFAIFWFACGSFVALVHFIQWRFDGSLIGTGPEDPHYYIKGMLTDILVSFFVGPIVLFIQILNGMPILPHRRN